MKHKINVIITDDHKLFRKGIIALLSDFDFINTIEEAANGIELLKLLATRKQLPDIILLDIRMPEMDGIEAQQRIKQLYPDIKIIVLSMEDDEQIVLHLVEEGVNGYLLKNADPDEMEFALKQVCEEDFYFSSQLSGLIVKSVAKKKVIKQEVTGEPLNKRELQVLELICMQNTAAEIADHMNLSVRTIEGYRRKLLEKTKSKNLAGLVVFALKNNLVSV